MDEALAGLDAVHDRMRRLVDRDRAFADLTPAERVDAAYGPLPTASSLNPGPTNRVMGIDAPPGVEIKVIVFGGGARGVTPVG